jgi:hypothetical protein
LLNTKASINSLHTPPKRKVSKDEAELGIQFMLAEFTNLQEFIKQSMSIEDKRIDVFLTLSSALLAGLGLLSQSSIDKQSFLFVGLGAALGLLAIGILVFQQVIHVDILIIDYIRNLNRVRCFFAEKAPHIRPYLFMPITHEYPKYNWQSSSRRIPMVVNSLSAGVSVSMMSLVYRQIISPDFLTTLIGGIVFIFVYLLQGYYAKRKFLQAETKAKQRNSVALYDSQGLVIT